MGPGQSSQGSAQLSPVQHWLNLRTLSLHQVWQCLWGKAFVFYREGLKSVSATQGQGRFTFLTFQLSLSMRNSLGTWTTCKGDEIPPSPCTYSSLCNNWWLKTWSAAPSQFPAVCCSCQCHRQPGPPARWRRSWAGPPLSQHCCSSLQTVGSSHQTFCCELLPSGFWVFSASSGLGAPSTWPGASSALDPSGNRRRLCQRKGQRTQQVRKTILKSTWMHKNCTFCPDVKVRDTHSVLAQHHTEAAGTAKLLGQQGSVPSPAHWGSQCCCRNSGDTWATTFPPRLPVHIKFVFIKLVDCV